MFENPISPSVQAALQENYQNKQQLVRAAQAIEDNTAAKVAERLLDAIKRYQEMLPEKDDVALRLVNFGSTITLAVQSMGYIGSNLVVFFGLDNSGKPMELIQHISQLNFLMTVASNPSPDAPKRMIGFAGEWK